MDDKMMYISDNHKQNYPFCRLKLLNETTWYSRFLELNYDYKYQYLSQRIRNCVLVLVKLTAQCSLPPCFNKFYQDLSL